MLSAEEERFLLRLARSTLVAYFKGEEVVPKEPPPDHKNLFRVYGAFVTLTKGNNLRGCIGNLVGEKPLYRLIPELTLSSAFKDPRFPPLRAEELSELKVEVSILSPLSPAKPEEVIVGKHGIYLVKGPYRGVLLPQVAIHHSLDRDSFLRLGCLKAGLKEDCLKDPEVKLFVFTAQVFAEE